MGLSETFSMMKEFFSSYIAYYAEIKKQDKWIRQFAEKKGFRINPHWMFYTNLKIWITESQQAFGKRYCPCFEPSGSEKLNGKLLCPCQFVETEVEERGTCHCVLFGRGDLTEEDFKQAENRLMKEYRVALNFSDGVLDTRGMVKDKLRNLPIPDSLHQVKRALGLVDKHLTVVVESEAEASNLKKLASFRNLSYQHQENGDGGFAVTLTKP